MKEAMKVLSKVKGEDETMEEYQARIKAAQEDKAWYKASGLEAERHLKNLQVHFKDIVKGLDEKEAKDWEEHKTALKAKANLLMKVV